MHIYILFTSVNFISVLIITFIYKKSFNFAKSTLANIKQKKIWENSLKWLKLNIIMHRVEPKVPFPIFTETYISAKTKLKKSHRINILMIYRLQKYRIQDSTSTFRSLDLFLSFTYKFLTYIRFSRTAMYM